MSDLPFGVERGFEEIKDNPFLVERSDDSGKLAELGDLDGIGPSTVRKLKDAGIREPSDLYGLTQEQIAAVDGIGPTKAAKLRRQVSQGGNRLTTGFRDDAIDKATKAHADRSKEERRTDESFNAKTSLSFSQWKENPGEYDMPGVDTIPRERRLDRTKRAAEELSKQGLVEDIEVTASGPRKTGVSGLATGTTARVKQAQNDPESTLAHELGHLADKTGGGRANLTNALFGPNMGETDDQEQKELREQGAKLASRRRSVSLKPQVVEERAEQGRFGGGGFNEVFADAFAEAVEEPRRAKKEAPDLVNAIQSEFREQKDGFSTFF